MNELYRYIAERNGKRTIMLSHVKDSIEIAKIILDEYELLERKIESKSCSLNDLSIIYERTVCLNNKLEWIRREMNKIEELENKIKELVK